MFVFTNIGVKRYVKVCKKNTTFRFRFFQNEFLSKFLNKFDLMFYFVIIERYFGDS